MDGEIGIETFRDEKIAQETVQETMNKVRTRVLAKSEAGSTDFLLGVPVKITLKDGRVFEHTTGRDDIIGGQKNPWGFDNIKSKFQVNARMVLRDAEADEAAEAWSDISAGDRFGGDHQRERWLKTAVRSAPNRA